MSRRISSQNYYSIFSLFCLSTMPPYNNHSSYTDINRLCCYHGFSRTKEGEKKDSLAERRVSVASWSTTELMITKTSQWNEVLCTDYRSGSYASVVVPLQDWNINVSKVSYLVKHTFQILIRGLHQFGGASGYWLGKFVSSLTSCEYK